MDWVGVVCAVAMGCLSSAVLVANNLRDIPTDAQSGKITWRCDSVIGAPGGSTSACWPSPER